LKYAQYHHWDLAGLPFDELLREGRRVQHVLDFSDRPTPWLIQRLDAIRQALAERQHSPEPTPGRGKDTPYQRRFAARVDRFKRRMYTDPYFGQPEHKAQGIPAARLVHKESADG
jgi:hypothetical protein